MKRSVKSLMGYTLGAIDGEIGTVKEFYFDDQTWTVRYLIVETGNWLLGRKVLISPKSLLRPDWEAERFPVNLTKEQIKNSPDIDTAKPVSRQQEMELNTHYSLGSYWGGGLWGAGMGIGTTGMMIGGRLPLEEAVSRSMNTPGTAIEGDPHLRSTKEVTGYNIHATDSEIGEVQDFIIDDHSWKLDYMVVETGNWLQGKKVLLSPDMIKEINWGTSKIIVNVPVARIKNSPEYDPSQPVSEVYEANLYDYYGRLVNR